MKYTLRPIAQKHVKNALSKWPNVTIRWPNVACGGQTAITPTLIPPVPPPAVFVTLPTTNKFLKLNYFKIFRKNSGYFWLPCKFTAALITYHFPLYMCEFGLLYALFSVLFFNDEKTLIPIKILHAKIIKCSQIFNLQGIIINFDFIHDLNPNEQEKKS